jgi:alpha-1,2-mannosyltransferase
VINRWDIEQPSKVTWLVLVLIVLAVWAWRSRRAMRHGDEVTAFALTGMVGVLISPITWVHHLVWVLPALILLVDRGLATGLSRRRRWWLLGLAAVTYVVMSSRLVWAFNGRFESFGGWLGSNAYVWLTLIMLIALPTAAAVAPAGIPRSGRPVEDVPDMVDLDSRLAVTIGAKPVRVPAQDEGARTEPARPLVGAEHP